MKGHRYGRSCSTCSQFVMIHELRNHGKQCIYCEVPDIPEGPSIRATEHKMAIEENRQRSRKDRRRRGP